jgi:hypothetical protein
MMQAHTIDKCLLATVQHLHVLPRHEHNHRDEASFRGTAYWTFTSWCLIKAQRINALNSDFSSCCCRCWLAHLRSA